MGNSPVSVDRQKKLPTSEVENPLKARRKKAPICFHCRAKKAIHLPRTGKLRQYTIFCSIRCACEYALKSVAESRYTWCLTHKRWSQWDGSCEVCELEKWQDRFDPIPNTFDFDQHDTEVHHE